LLKAFLPAERVLFVHAVKEHLYKNNFKNIDRYLYTEEGFPYFIYEGDVYTVSDLIEGNECDFEKEEDIVQAARLLAALHKASKGFFAPEGAKPRDELGKLPFYFNKRLGEIKKYKKTARRRRSKFDYMFLDCADYYYRIGQDALEALQASNYAQMVDAARKEGMICHRDFTHHNIIRSNGAVFVKGFDYCCFELKVYDIVNLIRRRMRKCDWNFDDAVLILNEYSKIESLNKDDMKILEIMLQFPQKFWRVINRYYNSRRSWSEKNYVNRLREVLEESERHEKFMEKFRATYR
jgi:CotS family spore coat protein